jgi:hypothetical protein
MPLTQKSIDELKAIYRRKYGEDLPNDEAWAMGHRLIRVFAFLTETPARADAREQGVNSVSVDGIAKE